ncbi:hypothetical protein [Streptomyces sp. CNQ085]|uniref:hypothetical protein n=1 Tax=Streptomyces sp. CNQ085 TaxID=2886944 RepID=UPI001F505DEA|nr:hypothetical protein [Streptomyces sp. CNQ085]MCI0383572.1 hypothetical protein [Streptomyces sp. CNQ085]
MMANFLPLSMGQTPSSGVDVSAVVFFALFSIYGWVTFLNHGDAARRVFGFFSGFTFTGPAAPGTFRFIGAGVAFIGTVGLIAEIA